MLQGRDSKQDAPLFAIVATPILGFAACMLFLFVATTDATTCLRICERYDGWVKMIGTICVLMVLGAGFEKRRSKTSETTIANPPQGE